MLARNREQQTADFKHAPSLVTKGAHALTLRASQMRRSDSDSFAPGRATQNLQPSGHHQQAPMHHYKRWNVLR